MRWELENQTVDSQGRELLGTFAVDRSSWRNTDLQATQLGWTSVELCSFTQTFQGTSCPLEIQGETVPANRILNGTTIGLWGAATHDDRDVALRVGLDVGKGDEAAVIGRLVLAPYRPHGCQVLLGACSAVLEGHAERAKFWFKVAHPSAKEEPSA